MPYTKPAIPANEAERLLALRELNVLDTAPEATLEDITLLASKICETPIALISLVDEKRQWFKSRRGIEVAETERDLAFCAHAIHSSETLVVEDASQDDRFKDNPLANGDPRVRFYAGAVLSTSSGHHIGTLCVIDHEPKKLTESQQKSLEALARQVVQIFEYNKLKEDSKERENFLSGVVGNLSDLVSYIDSEYTLKYINQSYARFLNLDPLDLTEKKVNEVLGKAGFAKVQAFMAQALLGNKQDFTATFPVRINGQSETRIVRIRYIPDVRSDGVIRGFYSVVNDITAIKNAEETAVEQNKAIGLALLQTQKSEEAFRAIFDHAPIGVLQIDSHFNFMLINEAYRNFLGYTEEELRKTNLLGVTHPEDLEQTLANKNSFLNDTDTVHRFEKRFVHKTGKTVWGSVTSRSVRVPQENKTYFFLIIEDISALREQKIELVSAQAKLSASSKMASLGEMAGGVAHEINNPLAIIMGKVALLKVSIETDQFNMDTLKEELTSIDSTGARIAKIISGLRAFSRSADYDPHKLTRVFDVIEETVSLCRARFKNHEIELMIKCPSNLKIECRATQISQVLMNLLNNAFDAVSSLEEKWVSIEVSEKGGQVRIRVTDSGNGISSDIVEKIMQPFFTTKDVGVGTGLGLSISKGIVESHQGHLIYEPHKMHTSFVIDLPVKAAA